MKCPVCGAETELVGFDGSRVIYQCRKNPLHFFSPKELFLKREFLSEIVSEREKKIGEIILELAPDLKEEYPDAKSFMVSIDPKNAGDVAFIGSRVASGIGMEMLTRGKIEELNNKCAMTIRVILWELEGRRDFKRRTMREINKSLKRV